MGLVEIMEALVVLVFFHFLAGKAVTLEELDLQVLLIRFLWITNPLMVSGVMEDLGAVQQ
jgi:hypothetical protein